MHKTSLQFFLSETREPTLTQLTTASSCLRESLQPITPRNYDVFLFSKFEAFKTSNFQGNFLPFSFLIVNIVVWALGFKTLTFYLIIYQGLSISKSCYREQVVPS